MLQCNLFVAHERGFGFPLAMNFLPPAVLPRDRKGGPGLRGQLERPPCSRTNTSGSLSFFLAGPISPIIAHRCQWRGNKTQMNSAVVSHVRILNLISAQSYGYDWLKLEALFGFRTPHKSSHTLSGLHLFHNKGPGGRDEVLGHLRCH